MKVKVNLGWLRERLASVVEYHRTNMIHICVLERRGNFISKLLHSPTKKPVECLYEYWSYMKTFHPWSELDGIWNTLQWGDMEHEVLISGELYSNIVAITKR